MKMFKNVESKVTENLKKFKSFTKVRNNNSENLDNLIKKLNNELNGNNNN